MPLRTLGRHADSGLPIGSSVLASHTRAVLSAHPCKYFAAVPTEGDCIDGFAKPNGFPYRLFRFYVPHLSCSVVASRQHGAAVGTESNRPHRIAMLKWLAQ